MGFIPNAWVLAFVAPVQVVQRRFVAALEEVLSDSVYYSDGEEIRIVAK